MDEAKPRYRMEVFEDGVLCYSGPPVGNVAARGDGSRYQVDFVCEQDPERWMSVEYSVRDVDGVRTVSIEDQRMGWPVNG